MERRIVSGIVYGVVVSRNLTELKMPNQDFIDFAEMSIGYGNPNAPIWFIGVEDGGHDGLSSVEVSKRLEAFRAGRQTDEVCKENILAEKRNGTRIYHFMVYILSRGATSELNEETMNYLINADGKSKFFQMNARPLPRPNQRSWPHQYDAIFGFRPGRLRRYDKAIRETKRFSILREFWMEHKPAVTVCFGKIWHIHKEIMQLEGAGRSIAADVEHYKIALGEGQYDVFLTPFFGRGSTPSNLKCVVERIEERQL